MDGQQQREALTAAERALNLLQKGRTDDAIAASQRAAELDQIDVFTALPDALTAYAESPGEDSLAALKEAVGPGPLAGLVEKLG